MKHGLYWRRVTMSYDYNEDNSTQNKRISYCRTK